MKNYLTEKEINVLGIQRTGQHAITSWLIGHFEKVCYCNNISQYGESKRKTKKVGPPWWYFEPSKKDSWDVCNEAYIKIGMDVIILGTEFSLSKFRIQGDFEEQKRHIAEKSGFKNFSKQKYYIVVVRNPYNQYASVLKWHRNKRLKNPKNFARIWCSMAKEVLKEENKIPFPKIFLYYDNWFISEDYRESISESLELKLNDRRLDTVMKIGVNKKYGSSFDGMKYGNHGQSMNVLNRWKKVKDDDSFIELTKNDEFTNYANKLGFSI